MNHTHFARLVTEYHEVNQEVHRIETDAVNTSDNSLNQRKKYA
ncbi:MAG: YdcH family protein [Halieaceae bacterium]|nr:YdcH family protein [Halieaceae bacterium]